MSDADDGPPLPDDHRTWRRQCRGYCPKPSPRQGTQGLRQTYTSQRDRLCRSHHQQVPIPDQRNQDRQSCPELVEGGHEFQAKFHWYVEDQGIRHAYIKRGTPQLNGKVERSHRSDQQELYQLLSYKGDVDLEAKLSEWENFYNFNRSHGTFNSKTAYEALRERL